MMYDWANSAHSVIVVHACCRSFLTSVAGFMRNTSVSGHEHLGLCHQHRHGLLSALLRAGYRRAGRF